MPTPKEAIAEALLQLDHKNDALWTDDGAPLVAEVSRLCNDTKITRQQINDALPGFVRKSSDSNTEEVQPSDEPAEDDISDEAKGAYQLMAPPDEPEAGDTDLSPEQEFERLRQIAYKRVLDAEAAVSVAKEAVSEALRNVTNAEARHTRALQLFSAKYPALTSAANIQLHLQRQQEILRERVTGTRFEPNIAQNPVDATLMDRKRDNGRNSQGKAPTSFLPRSLAAGH